MAIFSFSTSTETISKPRRFEYKNFILPKRNIRAPVEFEQIRVCAIIPAYKPTVLTERLIEDLLRWSPNITVCVVDDCTPYSEESVRIFESIRAISLERVAVIRTPMNRLKAGALNYGLEHVWSKDGQHPDVILTLDDDIVIEPSTVRNLVTELMAHEDMGAVCSQCHVLNKNKNLLTRLQGLEYLGFNATRLADEGFYMGPLVMHGMLTAFRTIALRQAGGFSEGHLIEDYEVTTRLKVKGWSVKSALNAHAWTIVPENFSKLWRQRARWSYGGITVVDNVKHLPSVLQDVIGHAMFWAMLGAINLLALGILFRSGGGISSGIPYWIIALSLAQFGIWFVFQLWLMRLYKEKDGYDWLIRLSVIPEFAYANLLTLVLVGSYFFLFFKTLTRKITERSISVMQKIKLYGSAAFRTFGYTENWGTRAQ